MIDPARLGQTLDQACGRLLQARQDSHWTGELSSSALATATAIGALVLAGEGREEMVIAQGLDWLCGHQNADGGWGDSPESRSNISTTCLCRSALALGDPAGRQKSVSAAEDYLRKECGSLEPAALAEALAGRYGKDRTFSAPILTMLAMAGMLGPAESAWKHVPPLPFELSVLPHSWLRRVRLGVVSYALPALIAIGLARFANAPPRGPVGWLRRLCRQVSLRKLDGIQPASGGFLEASPLTSFVAMNLTAAGQRDHPVARRCLEFLLRTRRPDGSWPIDVNLACWVTTLAVQALPEKLIPQAHSAAALDWLLAAQHRQVHPYTQSSPGGWAWTDLPGGLPDADDTASALLALRKLAPLAGRAGDGQVLASARAGALWLLSIQNADGGLPTFCRGWGALPFDRSSRDLTAHALRAWLTWRAEMPELGAQIDRGIARALTYLAKSQREDGYWTPLWFGDQSAPDQENPVYGTARVVIALAELLGQSEPVGRAYLPDSLCLDSGMSGKYARPTDFDLPGMIARGDRFLLDSQNADGGWGGAAGTPSSIEQTALALEALARISRLDRDWVAGWDQPPGVVGWEKPPAGRSPTIPHTDENRWEIGLRPISPTLQNEAISRGVNWLLAATAGGQNFPAAPIGLYFAKLWYSEKLYPLIFTVSALRELFADRSQ